MKTSRRTEKEKNEFTHFLNLALMGRGTVYRYRESKSVFNRNGDSFANLLQFYLYSSYFLLHIFSRFELIEFQKN